MATDGSIGSIDSTTNDVERRCLVVDTGFWIFGKRRMVPAGAITRVDHDDRQVHLSMTKDQIKDAPDYDEVNSKDESYFDRVGTYYQPYGY